MEATKFNSSDYNSGIEIIELIKKEFPNLAIFYQLEVGNFIFTQQELYENLSDVLRWLRTDSTYFLLYSDDVYALTFYND